MRTFSLSLPRQSRCRNETRVLCCHCRRFSLSLGCRFARVMRTPCLLEERERNTTLWFLEHCCARRVCVCGREGGEGDECSLCLMCADALNSQPVKVGWLLLPSSRQPWSCTLLWLHPTAVNLASDPANGIFPSLSLSLSSVNAFASSSSSSVAASATFAIDIYRLARERESGGSLSVVRMALAARAGQFTQTLIQSIAFSLLLLSRTLLTNSEYLRENIYSSAELDE